jgi:glutaminyl-tRNA synthetase
VEREDFMEDPPRRFYRLAPGREVRLRYAYFLKCVEVVKDEGTGEVVELRCEYDPETRGGSAPDGRRVRATLHWVSAEHSLPAEVRLFDHLFLDEDDPGWDPDDDLNVNPDSLVRLDSCRIEPSLADAEPGAKFQFERQGYFCVDSEDSRPGAPVFNRTVTLRDRWARVRNRQ